MSDQHNAQDALAAYIENDPSKWRSAVGEFTSTDLLQFLRDVTTDVDIKKGAGLDSVTVKRL